MTDVIVTMVKVADVNHLTLEVIDCFVTDGSHICWQMLLPYICKDRCYCPIVIGGFDHVNDGKPHVRQLI